MTPRLPLFLAGLSLVGAVSASAEAISLDATDAAGASSFNAGTNWTGGATPTSGNTYLTGNYLLRTPSTTGTYSFAGDSLTLNNTNGINGGFIVKSPGNSSITINNLIIDGGSIRDGDGKTDTVNLYGGINITSNGGLLTTQEVWNINSSLSGTGNLTVALTANLRLTFAGASTWTGNLIFANASSLFTLTNTGSLTFSIGANGVNNAITVSGSGAGTATFNGTFNFNLTGADTTTGDSWTIISSALTKTYGSTFAIANFTQETGNTSLWDNGSYQFNETTGVLSVVSAIPEPATYAALLGTAGLAFALYRRRKS